MDVLKLCRPKVEIIVNEGRMSVTLITVSRLLFGDFNHSVKVAVH